MICPHCGTASIDFDLCDSCHRNLPLDAKLYDPLLSPAGAKKPNMPSATKVATSSAPSITTTAAIAKTTTSISTQDSKAVGHKEKPVSTKSCYNGNIIHVALWILFFHFPEQSKQLRNTNIPKLAMRFCYWQSWKYIFML